jgi:hypothetical protein
MTGPYLGALLPAHAKGHCGFVSSWSAPGDTCRAPAVQHFLVDHPERRCGVFACGEHAQRLAELFDPLDAHAVTEECVHSSSVWQVTAPGRPGFCFVPTEDAEILESLEDRITT